MTSGEPQSSQRGRGRPALISRGSIIETACVLGLDGLSMSQVANELGVATQSLYRHIASRDDLVTLCIDKLVMNWEPVADEGQSTEDWLFEYGSHVRKLLLDHPGLARELQSIGPGTPQVLHLAEESISSLVDRGFSALTATLLIGSVAEIAIASVVRQQQLPAPLAGGDVASLITQAAITEINPDEIPHLSSVFEFLGEIDDNRYFSFIAGSLIDGMLRRLDQETKPTSP